MPIDKFRGPLFMTWMQRHIRKIAIFCALVLSGCSCRSCVLDDLLGIDKKKKKRVVSAQTASPAKSPTPPAPPGVIDDFNGDGTIDLLVGGFFNDAAGADAGRAYVFFGGAGLASQGAATADVILTGEAAGDQFAVNVAGGDVNADGTADVLVAAYYNDANGVDAGRVYVFFGGATLASQGAATADVILTGEAAGDEFGPFITTGDVNGDGVLDILAGGRSNDSGGADAGRVYVFFGGAGLSSQNAATADVIITGEAAGDQIGVGIRSADVSGDGTADLIVGAHLNDIAGGNAGRAYVFFGGAGLVSQNAATANVILTGEAADDRFGVSIGAGDVNGNGTADVLVGAWRNNAAGADAGRAYVFFGGAGLISQGAATADVIITGEAAGDNLGFEISSGDVNGNGTADLLVGAYWNDSAGLDAGRAYVFFGGPGLVSQGAATANVIITGEAAGDGLGISISAGDYNGNGTPDLVVGAYHNDAGGADAGRAYVFYGGAGLASQGAATADIILTGEAAGDNFGRSVSHP